MFTDQDLEPQELMAQFFECIFSTKIIWQAFNYCDDGKQTRDFIFVTDLVER